MSIKCAFESLSLSQHTHTHSNLKMVQKYRRADSKWRKRDIQKYKESIAFHMKYSHGVQKLNRVWGRGGGV